TSQRISGHGMGGKQGLSSQRRCEMPAANMKKCPTSNEVNPRIRFRNILFATDFSVSANLAMPFAGGLAKCFGAKLYALNVQDPINYALPPEAWQGVEQTRKTEIETLAQSIRKNFPSVTAEILQADGTVTKAVESTIKK